jgi:hypothetical protein
MSSAHEVISAFLDEEPFDSQELLTALSDPAGRALLIDLVALRQIVQPIEAVPPLSVVNPVRRPVWRIAAAAAALFLTLTGGYLVGERRASTSSSEAPLPTRVIQAESFVPSGGIR